VHRKIGWEDRLPLGFDLSGANAPAMKQPPDL